MKLRLPTMANNHRRTRSSLSLCLPALVVLLFHLLRPSDAAHAHGFDFPTGGLSTGWRITSSTHHVVYFTDGSQVRSPLVRRSREGFGPTYACGFYCWEGPCNSFLFSIFIVYTDEYGDIAGSVDGFPQVVWAANRGHPVGENATLHLGSDGDLALTDSVGTKVWSTNTSGRSVTGINLTEYGNLVLFGGDMNLIIWDSFGSPTDTLVPGQKLWTGQSLTANDSSTNSTEGLYYLYADSSGLIPFIKVYPPTRYSSVLAESSRRRADFFEFINGSIATSSSGQQYMAPTQFLRLEYDGHLRVHEWNATNASWNVVDDLITSDPYETLCFFPRVYGRYGICSEMEQCSCPHWDSNESNYFVLVDNQNPSLGCKEVTPLSCQSPYNHSLLRLDDLSCFPYHHQPADIVPTDDDRCRDACENNCSCKAAFFWYSEGGSSGDCYLAYEVFSLKNNQDERIHDGGSTVFIKVQIHATSANSSGSIDPTSSATDLGAWMPKTVILGFISGALFLLIPIVCCFIVRAREKILERRGMAAEDEEDDLEQGTAMPRRFSLQELITATDDFSKKLGQGGFGSVYEGRIDGTTVAVKRLDGVGRQGRKEFLAEVQTIGKIHHINIVQLIGYCAEKSSRLLVYEFMTNGSLDRWIFSRDQKACLDWQTRCKIIFGVAMGLSYLHEECSQRIAHLDIKPQNILLDDRFDAKISDFGLAKLIDRDQTHVETRMRGTRGYMAPEWLSSKITEKVDVYSFGVVVLEIICGRRNLDLSQPDEDAMLVSLLKRITRDGELLDLVDESIENTGVHAEEVVKMIKMTMRCLQDQNNRPSMSMVVKILKGALDVEYSDLEDVLWATSSVEECNGADAGSSAPVFASVLSGPR